MRAWRAIPDFVGYEVSETGEVRSSKRGAPRLLRPAYNPQGYLVAYLWRDGRVHRRTVHSLVAEVFIGPRPAGHVVRHLDGSRDNNRASNLTYGTHSDNTWDSVIGGTHHHAGKTHCPQRHPYDTANTYVRPDGGRGCRECRREVVRKRRARQQARGEVVR